MPTPAPLCTHIMPSGSTCGSPAVSGASLCYHHSAIKTALRKAASGQPIPFVFPEDRTSLQINYFLLLQAYTEGRIDLRTFNSMQRLLRSMAANLGNTPLAEDHALLAESPAAPQPPAIPAAHPAAATSDAPRPAKPAQPKPFASRALPSFEEIAAQHKPLGAECFLIPANQPASPLTD